MVIIINIMNDSTCSAGDDNSDGTAILNASRRPPRPGRKQNGPTNCWRQFNAAHCRTKRLKGWDERQKTKENGARKNWTAEERDEANKPTKVHGKQAQKLELKTGRMGLCFVSRTLGLQRIDGCRKNGGKAEATMEGKRERVGEGIGERFGEGGGLGGGGAWGGGLGGDRRRVQEARSTRP